MSEAKPTKGPWTVAGENSIEPDVMCGECFVAQCFGFDAPDEALANARIIADAGTVHHQTGLTPSQLVERVKELESSHKVTLGLLQELAAYDTYQTEYDGRMYSICNDCGGQDGEHRDDCAYTRANKHIAALSKARPNTAEGE